MLPRAFDIHDLARLSEAAESFATRIEAAKTAVEQSMELYKVATATEVDSADGSPGTSLVERIYSRLISQWLRPVPARVRGEMRLTIERLSRYVAASVYLSSHAVGHARAHENVALQGSDVQPDNNQPEVDLDEITSRPLTDVTAAIRRLRRFTTISQASASSSQPTSNLLGYWKEGQDPSSYEDTRLMAALLASDSPSAIPSSGESLEKRGAQNEKRQRRFGESMAKEGRQSGSGIPSAFHAKSTIPTREAAQPTVRDKDSLPISSIAHLNDASTALKLQSQQGPSRLTIASQIEPGRYGGRPLELRSKPRQRRAGF